MSNLQNANGTMKDWHLKLDEHNISTSIMESEDKIKELERVKESGLPYQHFHIFSNGITEKDILSFIRDKGPRFWISLSPKKENQRRYSSLDLTKPEQVFAFFEKEQINPSDFHIILLQYQSEHSFCGTAIFHGFNGIIEFVSDKVHTHLARGAHIPNPAIITNGEFERYSSEVPISNQRALAKLLMGRKGYFEFVRGIINGKEDFYFFSIKYDKTHMNYFKDIPTGQ